MKTTTTPAAATRAAALAAAGLLLAAGGLMHPQADADAGTTISTARTSRPIRATRLDICNP